MVKTMWYPEEIWYETISNNLKKSKKSYGKVNFGIIDKFISENGNTITSNVYYFGIKFAKQPKELESGVFFVSLEEMVKNFQEREEFI